MSVCITPITSSHSTISRVLIAISNHSGPSDSGLGRTGRDTVTKGSQCKVVSVGCMKRSLGEGGETTSVVVEDEPKHVTEGFTGGTKGWKGETIRSEGHSRTH